MNGLFALLSGTDGLYTFLGDAGFDRLALILGAALLAVAAIGRIGTWIDLDDRRRIATALLGVAFLGAGITVLMLGKAKVLEAELHGPTEAVDGLASGGCPVKVPLKVMVQTNVESDVGYEIAWAGKSTTGVLHKVDTLDEADVRVEFGEYHGPVALKIVGPGSFQKKREIQLDVNCTNAPKEAGAIDLLQDFESDVLKKEVYPDNRPSNPHHSAASVQPLRWMGPLSIVNGSTVNSGPVYQNNGPIGFPYVQADREAGLLIMHPGTFDTSQWGASLAFETPRNGEYKIAGAFQRANNARGSGDGVDVVIIAGTDVEHPLWGVEHISQDDYEGKSFTITKQLKRGQIVRFLVFSGPEGKDGRYDATSLKGAIHW